MNSRPIAMPTRPPMEQNMMECHSSCTRIQRMVKAAAVIPHDWIMSEKSRATAGLMPKASVMTGKATAPPPSLVILVNKSSEFSCINVNTFKRDIPYMITTYKTYMFSYRSGA